MNKNEFAVESLNVMVIKEYNLTSKAIIWVTEDESTLEVKEASNVFSESNYEEKIMKKFYKVIMKIIL